MPHKTAKSPKPVYRQKPPAEKSHAKAQRRGGEAFHEIPVSHFTLHDDGSVQSSHRTPSDDDSPSPGCPSPAGAGEGGRRPDEGQGDKQICTGEGRGEGELSIPQLIFKSESPFVRLYHGNCLTLLDAIAAKYPQGRFDAIFADPPYFLSNGGITCHAGRMVRVDKGDWDKSRGPEVNHEFNREWLARCQKVLKPNGTLWVSGTHHVIFSIGYALQQLGYKILNDIAWEKPNPPPNLSCRYFTHSTETLLWATRDEKSKHVFNYQAMRQVTGKQMKTVWRNFHAETQRRGEAQSDDGNTLPEFKSKHPAAVPSPRGEGQGELNNLESIWTLGAPGTDEKKNGKHPTQKPIALLERCLLASTNEGDLVLDPFMGGGTTAVACARLKRGCVGIELDAGHLTLAITRADKEIVTLWLRHFRVRMVVAAFSQPSTINHQPTFDLDLFSNPINGSRVDDKPQVPTERIFHECKFVFLSCAEVERGAVVHTTVDVSLQEAWAKTPNGKKRETTHIVRCETEIFRINQ